MNVSVGEIYQVTVVAVKPKFAVVKYEDGSTDIVHLSKISTNYVKSIDKFLSVGDHLEALAVSSEIKPYELSFKHLNLSEKEDKSFESDKPRDYYEYSMRKSKQTTKIAKEYNVAHDDHLVLHDKPVSDAKSIDDLIEEMNRDYEDKMSSKSKRRDRRNKKQRYKNKKDFVYD